MNKYTYICLLFFLFTFNSIYSQQVVINHNASGPADMCVPASLTFSYEEQGCDGIRIIRWTSSHGDSSPGGSPMFRYTSPGQYTVTLEYECGGTTGTAQVTFQVFGLPQVSITSFPDKICLGNTETFTQSSGTAGIQLWRWNFGAGVFPPLTENVPSVEYTYSTEGPYTIS